MFFINSRAVRYMRKPSKGWNPKFRASRVPFKKIDNFIDVFRAL